MSITYKSALARVRAADAEHDHMMQWIAQQLGVQRSNVREAMGDRIDGKHPVQADGKGKNWEALYRKEFGK
jgi:hypothetical protein